MTIQDEVRAFITKSFYVTGQLPDDESLLDSGTIDSTGVLEVIAFVEKRYSIVVGDREIRPENFDSVKRISVFVEKKLLGERASPPKGDQPAGSVK